MSMLVVINAMRWSESTTGNNTELGVHIYFIIILFAI